MYDYSEYLTPPTPRQLANLDSLIEELLAARERNDQKVSHQLACTEIPEEMHTLHLDEHITASGVRVTLDRSIRINVPAETRRDVHEWLATAGHTEVLSAIRGPFKTKQQMRKAEAAALAPLVAHLLEEGTAVPLDKINVSHTWKVKVAQPRRAG
ncbi:MAG: hypothetical protein AAF682_00090 [Planctomycetota bacterium]